MVTQGLPAVLAITAAMWKMAEWRVGEAVVVEIGWRIANQVGRLMAKAVEEEEFVPMACDPVGGVYRSFMTVGVDGGVEILENGFGGHAMVPVKAATCFAWQSGGSGAIIVAMKLEPEDEGFIFGAAQWAVQLYYEGGRPSQYAHVLYHALSTPARWRGEGCNMIPVMVATAIEDQFLGIAARSAMELVQLRGTRVPRY